MYSLGIKSGQLFTLSLSIESFKIALAKVLRNALLKRGSAAYSHAGKHTVNHYEYIFVAAPYWWVNAVWWNFDRPNGKSWIFQFHSADYFHFESTSALYSRQSTQLISFLYVNCVSFKEIIAGCNDH